MNNFSYKNLCPFKWFVLQNFPFIEADFDAITNWQLFCKLGEEMNKIIEKVNQTGEQTENLTNAFIELQNYVNDYFENLDVQEEINNKLDEMAAGGQLAEIINQEIFQELNTAIQNNTNDINDIENEINRYAQARETAVNQLRALYDKALKEVGEANAEIFEAHELMVEDGDYIDSVENIIRTQSVNAEYAVAQTGDSFSKMFL